MTTSISGFCRRAVAKAGVYRAIASYRSRHSPDAVFIWIPKVAGNSIWKSLTPFYFPKLSKLSQVTTHFPQRGLVTFGHQSYSQLLEQGYVDCKFDRRALKFCFVRNPFDRTVSLFHYSKKVGNLHHNTSFRTFCYLLRDRAFDEIGLFNSRGLSQCSSQTEWICDTHGKQIVDFIGRFETLAEDHSKICQRLGISASLPHLNQSQRTHYLNYYDDECVRIIADVYEEDCERFGYSFTSNEP